MCLCLYSRHSIFNMLSLSLRTITFVFVLIYLCDAECPNGWIRYSASCYKFGYDKETWIDAMNICQLFKANLAEVDNAKENNYLKSLVATRSQPAWLGASDLGIDGEWTWVGSRDDLIYTNWANGQPGINAIKENCMEMGTTGQWNDATCHQIKQYICEKSVRDSSGKGPVHMSMAQLCTETSMCYTPNTTKNLVKHLLRPGARFPVYPTLYNFIAKQFEWTPLEMSACNFASYHCNAIIRK